MRFAGRSLYCGDWRTQLVLYGPVNLVIGQKMEMKKGFGDV